MKGLTGHIFTVLLIVLAVSSNAQNRQSVDLSVSMEDFRLVKGQDGLIRVEALDPQYIYDDKPDRPFLPLRKISILVPNGAELVNFNFTTTDSLLEKGVMLQNMSQVLPTGYDGAIPKSSAVFEGPYSRPVISFTTNMIQRGYTWFSFVFSPFSYDEESGDLRLVKNVKLDVEYALNEKSKSVVRPNRETLNAIRKGVLNKGDLEIFYPEKEKAQRKSSGTAIDYLIITSNELKPAFLPLLEWKIRKGLKAEMISVDDIEAIYPDSAIQLSIKYYLHNRYVNGGLKWVLLGGDYNLVPVQSCYSYVLNGSVEVSDNTIPTDLYYACFDKRFDWNAHLDDKIGQVYQDDNDLVPEIHVSRIPVRNAEQVSAFVRKTLRYEQEQPSRGFSDRMLLAGVKTWSLWSGKSDAHHRSELMYADFVSDYWDGKMQGLFDTGSDFPGGSEYQVTASNLSDQLNAGYAYFHYAGHGDIFTLQMEEGPRFDVKNAAELTNTHAGVILSNACDVNAFDSIDPCLSEAFLRNPNGGGVAFFGSSRLGFGLPDISYSLGPSFQYNASFLNYLFSEEAKDQWKSFASIASHAKTDYADVGISGGTYLYLLYAINPMGDPELPLFTQNPSSFSKVRAYMLGEDLIVNTGGISNCRICVTGQDLGEGYQGVVENISNHRFEKVPDAFQLTITAPNYLPYILEVGSATDLAPDLAAQIKIYPNPVEDQLNVESDLFSGTLGLYDSQGRILAEQEINRGLNKVSMTAYPAGTYLLKIASEQGMIWQKVLKL